MISPTGFSRGLFAKRIRTLFVGESPPSNGTFFCSGHNAFSQRFKRAMEAAGLNVERDFLDRFQSLG